jgi:hypothetical protein
MAATGVKSGQSVSIKSGAVCKISYQLLHFMRWMWIVKFKTPYQFLFLQFSSFSFASLRKYEFTNNTIYDYVEIGQVSLSL